MTCVTFVKVLSLHFDTVIPDNRSTEITLCQSNTNVKYRDMIKSSQDTMEKYSHSPFQSIYKFENLYYFKLITNLAPKKLLNNSLLIISISLTV